MIYTELSPTPNSMKFVLNFEIVPEGLSFDYPDMASAMDEAKASPLAADIFQFHFEKFWLSELFFKYLNKFDFQKLIFECKELIKILFEKIERRFFGFLNFSLLVLISNTSYFLHYFLL